MVTYTIELTDAENKALGYIAFSQQDWIENAVKERCRLAIEQIVQEEVQRKLSIGESISGSKDDIVLAAPILSAQEREINRSANDI